MWWAYQPVSAAWQGRISIVPPTIFEYHWSQLVWNRSSKITASLSSSPNATNFITKGHLKNCSTFYNALRSFSTLQVTKEHPSMSAPRDIFVATNYRSWSYKEGRRQAAECTCSAWLRHPTAGFRACYEAGKLLEKRFLDSYGRQIRDSESIIWRLSSMSGLPIQVSGNWSSFRILSYHWDVIATCSAAYFNCKSITGLWPRQKCDLAHH